jgi:hypothetical protein
MKDMKRREWKGRGGRIVKAGAPEARILATPLVSRCEKSGLYLNPLPFLKPLASSFVDIYVMRMLITKLIMHVYYALKRFITATCG